MPRDYDHAAVTARRSIVAGHPAVLTLLVDNAGTVSGLRIEPDPKPGVYPQEGLSVGIQVKSDTGSTAGPAPQAQPNAGSSPSAAFMSGNAVRRPPITVRSPSNASVSRPDQDMKNFVDENRMTVLRTKDKL